MTVPIRQVTKTHINTRYLRFAKGYPFRAIGYRRIPTAFCMVGVFVSRFFFERTRNGVRKYV